MRKTIIRPELLAIVFGAVLLNTVPIWVGALARVHGLSDTVSGLHASLLLLSAASTCAGLIPFLNERSSAVLAFLALVILSAGPILEVFAATAACGALGLALGTLSRGALNCVSEDPGRVRMLSVALTMGLVLSLCVYLVAPLLQVGPFSILTVLAVILFVPRWKGSTSRLSLRSALVLSRATLRMMPFFVMMGAYWTFLELFGQTIGSAEAMSYWLLGSLVASAVGSWIAGAVPVVRTRIVRDVSLLVAAISGAASYVISDMLALGLTILANGFALFLFFPLYLGLAGTRATEAMAIYLLGFAFGGAAGALIVSLGGYSLLAATILVAGFVALSRWPFRRGD